MGHGGTLAVRTSYAYVGHKALSAPSLSLVWLTGAWLLFCAGSCVRAPQTKKNTAGARRLGFVSLFLLIPLSSSTLCVSYVRAPAGWLNTVPSRCLTVL